MGQKGKWENRDEKGRGTEKRQGERGRQGRRENNKLGEIERDREAGWESNHTLKADHCQPEEEETCIITAPSRERERGDPGGRKSHPIKCYLSQNAKSSHRADLRALRHRRKKLNS